MKLIVAADKNWGIGNHDKLLVAIPADMKFFREKTTGKVVVTGRKTIATFPGGAPLANRTTIVLSRNPDLQVKGAKVVHSVEELLAEKEQYDDDNVFVIGGASVYRQLLPYCDTAYVTKIDFAFEADSYFPNLDESPEWQVAETSEEQTYFDLEYTFMTYVRR